MAKITKTEQGRLDRKAEAQARKQAADERRSSRNEAQQRVDSNITPSTMGQREAAAGLTDTNTTSGRGLAEPTFSQREAAAGLTDTNVGRDDFYTKRGRQRPMWSPLEGGEMQAGSPMEFKADAAAADGSTDGEDTGSEPLYQDGAYTGPFAIKINGSYSTDGEGVVSQNLAFTIGVDGGTGTWPTKTQTFGGVSAPASANDAFYRVYGQIKASRGIGSDVLDVWVDPSIQIEDEPVVKMGSNTRYINNGSNYTFYFLIGTVGITVQPSGGYRIYVNQIQIGDYTYGEAKGNSPGDDPDGNDTRDGVRSLTICINATPYTADFELTNIVKVT